MTMLNLGCGKDVRKGWVNIDWKPGPGVNIVQDITAPLPFKDGSVKEVRAFSVMEHIADWEAVLVEVHRVLKIGGFAKIHVPYGLNCNTYHRRFFDESTMNGFLVDSSEFQGPNATTLEGMPGFRLARLEIERKPFYPYAWHLKKYLGLPYIGRKWAITFILQKVRTI